MALGVALAFIVYGVTRPPRRAYLVTPEAFAEFSGPALKVSDQTWRNRDNTTARGWLLKGGAGGPAVILSHRYGVDRSWFFNLGIKINEATGATILWPDFRGHGLNPAVSWTSFGSVEGEDIQAALDYLRTLKSADGQILVGDKVGLYGVEMGAYASLKPAASDAGIRVLVLDSLPRAPEEVLQAAVRNDLEIDNRPLRLLTLAATKAYFLGRFQNDDTCELAGALTEQKFCCCRPRRWHLEIQRLIPSSVSQTRPIS